MTTDRVICMQFIEGIPVHNVDKLRSKKIDLQQVSKIVLESFAAMIFSYGFVHCDPHFGNLMVVVEENKNKNKKPCIKVALLDHGLCK